MPESRIAVVAGVCGGRPTIRGLRVTVADVLELLAGGMSHDDIRADYPIRERLRAQNAPDTLVRRTVPSIGCAAAADRPTRTSGVPRGSSRARSLAQGVRRLLGASLRSASCVRASRLGG